MLFKMLTCYAFKIFVNLNNVRTVSYFFFAVCNSNCMILLTIDFFQVSYIGNPQSYVKVIYVGMNVTVIMIRDIFYLGMV